MNCRRKVTALRRRGSTAEKRQNPVHHLSGRESGVDAVLWHNLLTMPLVLEKGRWTEPKLVSQLEELRGELVHINATILKAAATMPNPWALDMGQRIVGDSIALADAVLRAEGPSSDLLVSVVNQLYETRNGLPYFIKAARLPPTKFPSPKNG
jgi:hypothetical protein